MCRRCMFVCVASALCMCVQMHVLHLMYVHMYVCMHLMYIYVHVSLWLYRIWCMMYVSQLVCIVSNVCMYVTHLMYVCMYVCMYVMHLMYACVDRIYCTYNITCMCGSHLMYTDIRIWCMYRMWCLCACMHVRMYHIWCMMYASQVHVCIVSNVCAYVCICLLKFTWVSIFMRHYVITAHGLPYAPSELLLASGPWWSSGSP